jgi:hypothetical protein
MIGYGFCAVRHRWLEYGKALALRARLAGLKMIGTSFCNGDEFTLQKEVAIIFRPAKCAGSADAC